MMRSIVTPALVGLCGLFVVSSVSVPGVDATHPERTGFTPQQRAFLDALTAIPAAQRSRMHCCFAAGTSEQYMAAVEEALYGIHRERYQPTTRWPGAQGTPIELTYSFVLDGVNVPPLQPLNGGVNQINALFNGIFGSADVWQAFFAESFARWSEMTGVSYRQLEDDGATLFGSAGSSTRGDIRISAITLDGPNGILAYNNLPQADLSPPGGSDMVMDAGDGANWQLAQDSHRFIRNVITHEHGHGLGLLHVCPMTQSKLMEPAISLVFDGPQHDDIRAGQRHYGDNYEENDIPLAAAQLGDVSNPTVELANLSLDASGDIDYFAFNAAAEASASITLSPTGSTYQSGGQGFIGCLFGPQPQTVNSLTIQDLGVDLLNADGTMVLQSAPAQPAGQVEQITGFAVPGAGKYLVRVRSSGGSNDVQTYSLSIAVNGGGAGAPGDINGDGNVDQSDLNLFRSVLLGVDPIPDHITRSDLNHDGAANGLDVSPFVGVMLN